MGHAEVGETISWATPEDFEACRRLHRLHGTTYYFATQRMPKELRLDVHALYGFVRKADEWVDDKERYPSAEACELLRAYRNELILAVEGGVRPSDPILRGFSQTLLNRGIPLSEALMFLDSMASDLVKSTYATYEELETYMRGSAAAVGLMMCSILGVEMTDHTRNSAIALGNAMQLTNFLRDVGEDRGRGRLYLPLEDLDRFGVSLEEIDQRVVTDRFVDLMKFEILRAKSLYRIAESGIVQLPKSAQKAVLLAKILYARILDKIEANNFDVLTTRARTLKAEKLWTAALVASNITRPAKLSLGLTLAPKDLENSGR